MAESLGYERPADPDSLFSGDAAASGQPSTITGSTGPGQEDAEKILIELEVSTWTD